MSAPFLSGCGAHHAEGSGNKGLFNNSAQSWNHAFYWNSLNPTKTEPAGDRVEVKIKSKWVKGKVKRTHKDGTLDVDASNGEKARRIDPEDVRARDGSDDEGGSKIGVGDKVLYSKYAGTDIKLSGDEYVLLSEKDILAVVS